MPHATLWGIVFNELLSYCCASNWTCHSFYRYLKSGLAVDTIIRISRRCNITRYIGNDRDALGPSGVHAWTMPCSLLPSFFGEEDHRGLDPGRFARAKCKPSVGDDQSYPLTIKNWLREIFIQHTTWVLECEKRNTQHLSPKRQHYNLAESLSVPSDFESRWLFLNHSYLGESIGVGTGRSLILNGTMTGSPVYILNHDVVPASPNQLKSLRFKCRCHRPTLPIFDRLNFVRCRCMCVITFYRHHSVILSTHIIIIQSLTPKA
jgi:hypothetical protein